MAQFLARLALLAFFGGLLALACHAGCAARGEASACWLARSRWEFLSDLSLLIACAGLGWALVLVGLAGAGGFG